MKELEKQPIALSKVDSEIREQISEYQHTINRHVLDLVKGLDGAERVVISTDQGRDGKGRYDVFVLFDFARCDYLLYITTEFGGVSAEARGLTIKTLNRTMRDAPTNFVEYLESIADLLDDIYGAPLCS